jgi:DNA-binding transcriptional LysR family regulator
MQIDERIGSRLKLRDLNIFLAVVEGGSMSKAAAQLAVSQPAVSKAISNMEYALGVPLLERKARGVEPTLYGRALTKRGLAVFDELRQSAREIEFLADPTKGEVRIGCTQPLAAGLVPAVIDKITRQYPGTSFNVSEGDLAALQDELRDRTIELMIGRTRSETSDEDLNSEVLFDDRFLVVAGVRNKWAHRRKIHISELIAEHWTLPPYDGNAGSLIVETFRAAGVNPPKPKASTYSLAFHLVLLATGRFLCMLPESTIRFSGKYLPLKVLPVELPAPQPVKIITLKGRVLNPLAEVFIASSREIIRPFLAQRSDRD